MNINEISYLTAHEARALLDKGEFSAVELAQWSLDRIEALDNKVHAFLVRTPEQALEAAAAADRRRALGGMLGPLDGIPMTFKDVMLTRGVYTRAGSKMLEHFIAPYDGTVVAKMLAAGVVPLGKTN